MLNKASLKTALQSLFEAPPATKAECADAWASAYKNYASGAQSCQSGSPNPAALTAAEAILSATLLAAFNGTNASDTATAFSTAMSAFWLLPPVLFSGVTPGLVTVVAGAPALQSALLALWSANVAGNVSAADAAQGHADIFHAFSLTVVVTHAPPTTCTGPIS